MPSWKIAIDFQLLLDTGNTISSGMSPPGGLIRFLDVPESYIGYQSNMTACRKGKCGGIPNWDHLGNSAGCGREDVCGVTVGTKATREKAQ